MTRTRLTTESEIVMNTQFAGNFSIDRQTTAGLTLGINAGVNTSGATIHNIAATTVDLTDDATNYVFLAQDTIAASPTVPDVPGTLYKVTTASGAITAIEDHRGAVPSNKSTFP